ncbi:hypothetical protein [Roseovarius aestuariivivens]|uniref:hypothetical protein n=1 Tax=Roseovarius aestuariivivens TaxID=1888910 RepID=UPI0010813D91|nr:hypothetical protein [Roseovarius aestuariivivens]
MPLFNVIVIIVCAVTAAGLTVWAGALIASAANQEFGWFILLPALLCVHLLFCLLARRDTNVRNRHDDRLNR